jgi:hypothetical protein
VDANTRIDRPWNIELEQVVLPIRASGLDGGKIVYRSGALTFGADEQRVRELAGAENRDIDGVQPTFVSREQLGRWRRVTLSPNLIYGHGAP